MNVDLLVEEAVEGNASIKNAYELSSNLIKVLVDFI